MFRHIARTALRRSYNTSALRGAQAGQEGAAAAATQINLNFQLPHGSLYTDEKVDLLVIPGAGGEYGVTAGHVPILSELKPGILQVRGQEIEKYFVAGGFAITHANSNTDISAVEAVKLEDLDPEAARAGLATYKSAMESAAPGSVERADAQIGYEVHLEMCRALGVSAA